MALRHDTGKRDDDRRLGLLHRSSANGNFLAPTGGTKWLVGRLVRPPGPPRQRLRAGFQRVRSMADGVGCTRATLRAAAALTRITAEAERMRAVHFVTCVLGLYILY